MTLMGKLFKELSGEALFWSLHEIVGDQAVPSFLSSQLEEIRGALTRYPELIEKKDLYRSFLLWQSIRTHLQELSAFIESFYLEVGERMDEVGAGLCSAFAATCSQLEMAQVDYTVFTYSWQQLLCQYDDAQLATFLKKNNLGRYADYFKKVQEEHKQLGNPKEELFGLRLALEGLYGWEKNAQQIHRSVSAEMQNEKLSLAQLDFLKQTIHRQTRNEAFNTWQSLWQEQEVLLSNCLNHVVGYQLKIWQQRNWPWKKARYFRQAVSQETVDSMWKAFGLKKAIFWVYFDYKCQYWGQGELKINEIGVPVDPIPPDLSYQEALTIISEGMAQGWPELSEWVRQVVEKNMLQIRPNSNSIREPAVLVFPLSAQVRISIHYFSRYSDMLELTRLLTRAYLHSQLLSKPVIFQEMHPVLFHMMQWSSVFALHRYCCLDLIDREANFLLSAELLQSCLSLLLDCQIQEGFEQALYELRKEDLLTAKELCELASLSQEKALGPKVSEKDPYFWAAKDALYNSKASLQSWQGAMGCLLALKFFFSEDDYKKNLPKLEQLLEKGSVLSIEKLVKEVFGEEMNKAGFWQSCFDGLDDLVQRFSKLMQSKGRVFTFTPIKRDPKSYILD